MELKAGDTVKVLPIPTTTEFNSAAGYVGRIGNIRESLYDRYVQRMKDLSKGEDLDGTTVHEDNKRMFVVDFSKEQLELAKKEHPEYQHSLIGVEFIDVKYLEKV